MNITIKTSKKDYKVVPFKIAPETFETLKKIQKAVNRTYAEIFSEMASGYYDQVLDELAKQHPDYKAVVLNGRRAGKKTAEAEAKRRTKKIDIKLSKIKENLPA